MHTDPNQSDKPRKRRREYLETDHDSELVRFVLATQGKDETETYSYSRGHARSVSKTPSEKGNHFGLQKRRMIESFKGLTLEGYHMSSPSRPVRTKKKLVQVLNSVEFSDYERSSEIEPSLDCGDSMIDSEFGNIEGEAFISTKGNFSDDRSWNQTQFSEFSSSSPTARPEKSSKKTHTYIPTEKGIVKYQDGDNAMQGQETRFPLHQSTTFFLDNVSLE